MEDTANNQQPLGVPPEILNRIQTQNLRVIGMIYTELYMLLADTLERKPIEKEFVESEVKLITTLMNLVENYSFPNDKKKRLLSLLQRLGSAIQNYEISPLLYAESIRRAITDISDMLHNLPFKFAFHDFGTLEDLFPESTQKLLVQSLTGAEIEDVAESIYSYQIGHYQASVVLMGRVFELIIDRLYQDNISRTPTNLATCINELVTQGIIPKDIKTTINANKMIRNLIVHERLDRINSGDVLNILSSFLGVFKELSTLDH